MRNAERHFQDRKPCLIAEACGTIEAAVNAMRQAKEQHQIGAVCVDYVQMLKGKGASRYEQISDVSTQLKQEAVRQNVVLIAICQLNRQVEARGGGEYGRNGQAKQARSTAPRMSDLRDSGQLEQDADVILFVEWLYRTPSVP